MCSLVPVCSAVCCAVFSAKDYFLSALVAVCGGGRGSAYKWACFGYDAVRRARAVSPLGAAVAGPVAQCSVGRTRVVKICVLLVTVDWWSIWARKNTEKELWTIGPRFRTSKLASVDVVLGCGKSRWCEASRLCVAFTVGERERCGRNELCVTRFLAWSLTGLVDCERLVVWYTAERSGVFRTRGRWAKKQQGESSDIAIASISQSAQTRTSGSSWSRSIPKTRCSFARVLHSLCVFCCPNTSSTHSPRILSSFLLFFPSCTPLWTQIAPTCAHHAQRSSPSNTTAVRHAVCRCWRGKR